MLVVLSSEPNERHGYTSLCRNKYVPRETPGHVGNSSMIRGVYLLSTSSYVSTWYTHQVAPASLFLADSSSKTCAARVNGYAASGFVVILTGCSSQIADPLLET